MAKPVSSPTAAKARKPVAVPSSKKGPQLGSYANALKWLYDRVDIERTSPSRLAADTLKLDRMHRLMELLGNPHRAFRSVHVAGTKGKGSTCVMTATCLEACGYAVGLYTSPHLVDVRERIQLNRRMIGQPEFTKAAQRVADAAANIEPSAGEPTFFELTTAMAFLYFAEEAVDAAVIEVGLGGRLDSTNVITPEVTAVTSISLDHTQILGETLEKIAREKAGIFKPGVPAITIQHKPTVLQVFRDVAAEVGAPLQVLGQDVEFSLRYEASPRDGTIIRVNVTTDRNAFEHLVVPLKGEHQAVNCGLALALLDKLSERGFKTPANKVTRGLADVRMPGRMEIAWESPRVLLDGAHNTDSVKCLIKAIGAHIPYDSMVLIFGCATDKDVDGMLREIGLGADKVIFTRSGNQRACDPRDLARRFGEATGKMAQTAKDFPEALALAARAVGREDLICVTGSLYLVGEAKKHLDTKRAARAGG
jgi:dihydrofolate synthase / folylpolyglutamate synthase